MRWWENPTLQISRRKAGIGLAVESFGCLFFSAFAVVLAEVGNRGQAVHSAVLALVMATLIPMFWRAWRKRDEPEGRTT